MVNFNEGQSVTLRENYPDLGLMAGDTGVIWAAYDTDPRSYEATFFTSSESAFDMTVAEGEIEAVPPVATQAVKSLLAFNREVEVT